MPNGQTDVFSLTCDEFLALLDRHPDGILRTLESGTSSWAETAIPEVAAWARRCGGRRIAVEEQHGTDFIVHLGPDWKYWIEIGPGSPLHAPLRRIQRGRVR